VLEDTIIAISTPPGIGGLGIVRISGRKALAVARRIFSPKSGLKRPFPVMRPVFGTVRDPERGVALDEAFLTYFKAPRSYTREDIVELSAHGSPAVLEGILRSGTKAGARLARPGEFTLRAHLNGRLDILQAEASAIIRSYIPDPGGSRRGGSGGCQADLPPPVVVGLLARVEAGLEFPDGNLGRAPQPSDISPIIADVQRLVS
jgi:tRNA modification GTPase